MKIKESSLGYLKEYSHRLNCFDDNLSIRGSFNSGSAQALSIQFIACDYLNNSTCKSYDEISKFMRRKFILTLENHSLFKTDKYDHRKITKEAGVKWHLLNSVLR